MLKVDSLCDTARICSSLLYFTNKLLSLRLRLVKLAMRLYKNMLTCCNFSKYKFLGFEYYDTVMLIILFQVAYLLLGFEMTFHNFKRS